MCVCRASHFSLCGHVISCPCMFLVRKNYRHHFFIRSIKPVRYAWAAWHDLEGSGGSASPCFGSAFFPGSAAACYKQCSVNAHRHIETDVPNIAPEPLSVTLLRGPESRRNLCMVSPWCHAVQQFGMPEESCMHSCACKQCCVPLHACGCRSSHSCASITLVNFGSYSKPTSSSRA